MFVVNGGNGVQMRSSIGNLEQKYSKRGKTYRLGKKPSYILYYTYGSIYINYWYNSNSFLHRYGGPALLWYSDCYAKIKWMLWYNRGTKYSGFFIKN